MAAASSAAASSLVAPFFDPAPATPSGIASLEALGSSNSSQYHGAWSKRCVLARLQKAGGTAAVLMSKEGSVSNVFVLPERGGMREDTFHKNTFVIGQIRNPFDWYSSIWAYLSEPYNMRWVPEETKATLSSEMPRGSTWADRKRFRSFVRLYAKPEIGALSLHFWVNYVDLGKTIKELNIAKHLEKSVRMRAATALERFSRSRHASNIRCWTRQEDLYSTLGKCLERCELELNATRGELINWTAFEQSDTRRLMSNPSRERASNAELYDEDTIQRVATADKYIFQLFEYDDTDPSAGDSRAAGDEQTLVARATRLAQLPSNAAVLGPSSGVKLE